MSSDWRVVGELRIGVARIAGVALARAVNGSVSGEAGCPDESRMLSFLVSDARRTEWLNSVASARDSRDRSRLATESRLSTLCSLEGRRVELWLPVPGLKKIAPRSEPVE